MAQGNKSRIPMTPTHRIANPKSVSEWERALTAADDEQISAWLLRRWSLWRQDMLFSVAFERGIF